MSPGGHAITSVLASTAAAVLHPSPALAIGIAAGGFLIDADHALDYVLVNRQTDLRPAAFLRYYLEGRPQRVVLPLHSYEVFVLLIGIAWSVHSSMLWGYVLGGLMHLVLDILFNGELLPRNVLAFYSLGYRAAHHFQGSALHGGRPRERAPESFWQAFFTGARATRERRGSAVAEPRGLRGPAKRRVLIVEDDRSVAEIFREHVLDLGHDAVVTATAEDALRALETDPIDAVFLNLNVPGMEGLQLLQLGPVRTRSIPVVVSGAPTDARARDCLRLGALEFVSKPVSLARLSEVLGFLELHLLNSELADRVKNLDRRRCVRVSAAFPVHLIGYGGAEWLGTSVDMSPFGVRVRSEATLAEGATVKLHFTPPDGPPSLTLLSVLARVEPDGQAFYFVNLTRAEFERMRTIVQALSTRPATDEGAPLR